MVENLACGTEQGRSPAMPHRALPKYFAVKAWPARCLGLLLLVLASPLILLLVVIVRLTSPGPGIFRQTRTGKDGREFQMYKIRTMYVDAETVSGPTWCKPGDSRITPLGRVLRLLHLDELPQLLNIVQGEMDLVGPRPERPSFVDLLEREIPNYRDRLQVLPGVTGLAQVNLPPDETVNCVRKKLLLDCDYIQSASISLDLRILVCTSLRMLGIRHGRAVRMFRLERQVTLPTDDARTLAAAINGRDHVPAGHRPELAHVGLAINGKGGKLRPNVDVEDCYAVYEPETVTALAQAARRPR
jgi:lipopolysaccharide/colanic/teichoic acid biosynthesis glycosyltransferase